MTKKSDKSEEMPERNDPSSPFFVFEDTFGMPEDEWKRDMENTYTMDEMDEMAKERGMSPAELLALMMRDRGGS
jgi:hypothetical protein